MRVLLVTLVCLLEMSSILARRHPYPWRNTKGPETAPKLPEIPDRKIDTSKVKKGGRGPGHYGGPYDFNDHPYRHGYPGGQGHYGTPGYRRGPGGYARTKPRKFDGYSGPSTYKVDREYGYPSGGYGSGPYSPYQDFSPRQAGFGYTGFEQNSDPYDFKPYGEYDPTDFIGRP